MKEIVSLFDLKAPKEENYRIMEMVIGDYYEKKIVEELQKNIDEEIKLAKSA